MFPQSCYPFLQWLYTFFLLSALLFHFHKGRPTCFGMQPKNEQVFSVIPRLLPNTQRIKNEHFNNSLKYKRMVSSKKNDGTYCGELTCESQINGFMFICFVFRFTFNLLLQYA